MLIQFILVLLYQVFNLALGWTFPWGVHMFFDRIINEGIDPISQVMYSMPFIPWVALYIVIGAIVAIYVGLFLVKFVMLIIGMVKGFFSR